MSTGAVKRCSRCETPKELAAFYRDKRRKDGLTTQCKACQEKVRLERMAWKKLKDAGIPVEPRVKPAPKNKGPRIDKLTRELILEQLNYDRATGSFTWAVNKHNKYAFVGNPAGKIDKGYVLIKLFGKDRKRANLVWIVETGSEPPQGMVLDHIDRNRVNDHISNLRLATHEENAHNRGKKAPKRSPHTSAFKGVFKNEYGSWTTSIMVNGKRNYLGAYKDEVEAAVAYNEAAKRFHGDFAYLNPINEGVN